MRKKGLFVCAAVMILAAAAGLFFGRGIAEKTPNAEEIRKSNELLKEAEYQGYQEVPGLPGTDGKVHIFRDADNTYYVNAGGYIVRIDNAEGTSARYPDQEQSGFGRDQAVKEAEKLFDDVFEEAETELGHKKKIEVSDFSGVDYLVTIVLLRDGRESGYKASISYATDGRLISSLFIWETYADRSDEITEERARELALEYFYEHYGEIRYVAGYQVLEVEVLKADYLVWEGKGYYDVYVTATYSRKEPDGSNLKDPGWIRIRAKDGEYIWYASTFEHEK